MITAGRQPGWREFVAVGLGGALGTGLRLGIDVALPASSGTFPAGTLAINAIGSLGLGFLVATVWHRSSVPNAVKAGVGVGVLGAFTTFSAVMVTVATEASAGRWPLAVAYLAASVMLGLGAAAAGLLAGARLGTARPGPDAPASNDWTNE